MVKAKNEVKLLFVNVCLRPGGYTKFLPVGLGSVITYFKTKGCLLYTSDAADE